MKIAHLSDIHFFKFDLGWNNFFSKDLLATLNYLVNRSRHRVEFDVHQIPQLLKDKKVECVIITGDFTTTSNLKEYAEAKQFLQKLSDLEIKTLIIPGNHDSYNHRASSSKRFYQKLSLNSNLIQDEVTYGDLGEGFKYILLDTTLATPLWSSQGLFSEKIENKLIKLLDSIPKDQPLILINHFPIITRKHMPIRHQMVRFERLKKIIETYPNIKIYMNGHTHLSEIIKNKPLILNSGSLTLTEGGSFHIYELQDSSIEIEVYSHQNNNWEIRLKELIEL